MDKEEKQFSGGRKYINDQITVYWKPSACIHASYCYRELIEVFDPSRRPWVDLNGSTTSRIIEVVNLCPTEALAWKWNDEEKNELYNPISLIISSSEGLNWLIKKMISRKKSLYLLKY